MNQQPQPLDVAELLIIDPTTVDPDMDNRIGLYFPAKAEALGFLMARDGQNDPIKVVPHPLSSKYDWKLVAGLHRLNGSISANINVAAFVMSAKDDLRAIQASENVDRRELEPLERAMFVYEVAEKNRARLIVGHGDVSQQVIAGRARAAKVQYSDVEKADEAAKLAVDNLSIAYSWKAETAQALGYSPKDIQRSMRIYRCIVEDNRDLMDAFKDLDVAKSADALLKIAALKDAALRRKVIETLIGGPKDLTYVFQKLGITPPKEATSTYAKFSSQILGGFSRLGTAEKRRFIPELVTAIPVGMRSLVREELDRLDAEGGAA